MSTWTVAKHDQIAAQARQLAEILAGSDNDGYAPIERQIIASPAGSERALRGIPVVGAQGVGGTIAGTNPLAALMSRQPRE